MSKQIIINNNCDGQGCGDCISENSVVRILPLGGGANAILCKNHYQKEIIYRTQRNLDEFTKTYWKDNETLKQEKKPGSFDLPKWEDLQIYYAQE
jgi:hypothetical protein